MPCAKNEIATASLGIPTSQIIVTAFMWSGFIVGIAGAMFALHTGRVFPESFGLTQLIVNFAMVLVGGLGSVVGAVLGAVALTALPEYVRAFPGMEEIFFGVIVMVVLLVMPKGLASLLARFFPRSSNNAITGTDADDVIAQSRRSQCSLFRPESARQCLI
ncbi:branched-chain amino acid ABC transporter permease [Roseibium salinum]|nr:branched-chain amino acid ABC transporter permease [Roseibium salinum]